VKKRWFFNIFLSKNSFHFLLTGFHQLLNISFVDIFIVLTFFSLPFLVENM